MDLNINLPPNLYVVAVSGGVDSMALLHILSEMPDIKLVVAHFDHGIRQSSTSDRQLVQKTASRYGLPFVYDEVKLGSSASEALARKYRYKFLRHVRQASGARAIITAHHQDDLLETAIINLVRGGGRKGVAPLFSQNDIVRPILGLPKQTLIDYANRHNLVWHDDETNFDDTYLRNYIRHHVIPRLDGSTRDQLLKIILHLKDINLELDRLLINRLHDQTWSGKIDRRWFCHLPHITAKEMLATWLRSHGYLDFNRRELERLVVSLKVSQPNRVYPLSNGYQIVVEPEALALTRLER